MARRRRARLKARLRSRPGLSRAVPAKIMLHRTSERGPAAFEACIRVGGSAGRVRAGFTSSSRGVGSVCGFGRNPRKAIGNALKKAGQAISRRSGAFSGSH